MINALKQNNCRAQATPATLFVLIEIIMVVAAGFLIFQKISSIESDQLFLKKFYARDIALTLDAMQGLQGNVLYIYKPTKETLSKITFKLTPTAMHANDEVYPVAIKTSPEIIVDKPTTLRIVKENNQISFEQDTPKSKPFNQNKINCPEIATTITGTIALDAGHGFNPTSNIGYVGDIGFVGNNGEESVLIAQLAANLETNLKFSNFAVKTTRDPRPMPEDAMDLEMRKTKTKDAAIIISLHANKDASNINNIKAYVNRLSPKYLESVKLACTILNEISDAFPLQTTGAAIVPLNDHQLDENDPKQLLIKEKVAVQIEVGNVDSTNAVIKKSGELSAAIAKGVSEYNKQ